MFLDAGARSRGDLLLLTVFSLPFGGLPLFEWSVTG
jgi:hypothetical protein